MLSMELSLVQLSASQKVILATLEINCLANCNVSASGLVKHSCCPKDCNMVVAILNANNGFTMSCQKIH